MSTESKLQWAQGDLVRSARLNAIQWAMGQGFIVAMSSAASTPLSVNQQTFTRTLYKLRAPFLLVSIQGVVKDGFGNPDTGGNFYLYFGTGPTQKWSGNLDDDGWHHHIHDCRASLGTAGYKVQVRSSGDNISKKAGVRNIVVQALNESMEPVPIFPNPSTSSD